MNRDCDLNVDGQVQQILFGFYFDPSAANQEEPEIRFRIRGMEGLEWRNSG